MNHVLVQIGKGKHNLQELISDIKIFNLPDDLENSIAYDPAYQLNEDEWFKIECFSEKSFSLDIVNTEYNSADYDAYCISGRDDEIEYLCSYQEMNEEKIWFFQRVTKTQLLKKCISFGGDGAKYVEDSNFIIIKEKPDAIVLHNVLYFKNLASLFCIFKGIDQLYREATDGEVSTFLKSFFISLSNDYNSQKVKTANRKRIALAMDTLEKYGDKKEEIISYTHEYCPELEFKDNKFLIKSELDLKLLLLGIGQRFYTTPVTNEKVVAGSVTALKNFIGKKE
jgi:hypothetical protein